MKNNKVYTGYIFYLLLFFLLFPTVVLGDDFIGHREEDTVMVYDEQGNYVFATAMGINSGDRYINEDNIEYEVKSINGKRAIAQNKGKVDLFQGLNRTELTPLAAQGKKLIGIYFTHNDESYRPGPESIEGQGEIHDIGYQLKNALEKMGIQVIVKDNLHLPHDGAAYERSRASATDLMKNRPDAIFDLHRDAIPQAHEYLAKINGQLISQVRLVVGRQNPNLSVNDNFAKQLKAVCDEKYPGLIKGIFYGSGNYNQQLSTHSLLLEFGTHVTTEAQAASSATMIADSINSLLYGDNISNQDARNIESKNAYKTIAWIVTILFVGILAFLFINEGSWQGVVNRIKSFLGREIIDRGEK
ncbi:MAG: stage II sporulation protein P [Firmicutes bacterium]|nr:stage II sporulation protein P [Bacillota bacterium]